MESGENDRASQINPAMTTRNPRRDSMVVVKADIISTESKYVQRCVRPEQIEHTDENPDQLTAAAVDVNSSNSSDQFIDKLVTASDDGNGGSVSETGSLVSAKCPSKAQSVKHCHGKSSEIQMADNNDEIETIVSDTNSLQEKSKRSKKFLKRMKSWCKETITKMPFLKAKNPNTISDVEGDEMKPNLYYDIYDPNLFDAIDCVSKESNSDLETCPVVQIPEKEETASKPADNKDQGAILNQKLLEDVNDEREGDSIKNNTELKISNMQAHPVTGISGKENFALKVAYFNKMQTHPYHQGAIPKEKRVDNIRNEGNRGPIENSETLKTPRYHHGAIPKEKRVDNIGNEGNRGLIENSATLKTPSYHHGAIPKEKRVDNIGNEGNRGLIENSATLKTPPYHHGAIPKEKRVDNIGNEGNRGLIENSATLKTPPYHHGAIPKRKHLHHSVLEKESSATENPTALKILDKEHRTEYAVIGIPQEENFTSETTNDNRDKSLPSHHDAILERRYSNDVAEEDCHVIVNAAALKTLNVEPFSASGMPEKKYVASTTTDHNKDPPPLYYQGEIPKRIRFDHAAAKDELCVIENTAALKSLEEEQYAVVGMLEDHIERQNLSSQGQASITEHQRSDDFSNENAPETIENNAKASHLLRAPAAGTTGTEIIATIVSQIENEAAELDLTQNTASGNTNRNSRCDVLERARKITLRVLRICKTCGKVCDFFSCSGETVIMRLLEEHLPVTVTSHKSIHLNNCKYCDQCIVECAWMIMDNLRDVTFPKGSHVTFCYICNCSLDDTLEIWRNEKKDKEDKKQFSDPSTKNNSGVLRKMVKRFFKKKEKSSSGGEAGDKRQLNNEPQNLGAVAAASDPEISEYSAVKLETGSNSDDSFDSI